MQSTELSVPTWQHGDSVELQSIPSLDRFFPDCELGLIELFARAQWGLRDLKKVWFANTFEYTRSSADRWLAANQIEFAGRFAPAGDVRGPAFARLWQYYGVTTSQRVYHEFSVLFADVQETLRQRQPVLSCLDMSFLQAEGRAKGLFQPHMVAIVGWNAKERLLKIVDQVRGCLSFPLTQYEESLERYRANGCDFYLLECSRTNGEAPVPLKPDMVQAQIREALANLCSSSPNLGLCALKALGRDVALAVEWEQRAFAIPGLWIVSHDRHALRQLLPYWREAGVGDDDALADLNRALKAAFAAWFDIDMSIERSLHEQNPDRMMKVAESIMEVAVVEGAIAKSLERIASQ